MKRANREYRQTAGETSRGAGHSFRKPANRAHLLPSGGLPGSSPSAQRDTLAPAACPKKGPAAIWLCQKKRGAFVPHHRFKKVAKPGRTPFLLATAARLGTVAVPMIRPRPFAVQEDGAGSSKDVTDGGAVVGKGESGLFRRSRGTGASQARNNAVRSRKIAAPVRAGRPTDKVLYVVDHCVTTSPGGTEDGLWRPGRGDTPLRLFRMSSRPLFPRACQ
jgi:hypothetical protein